MKKRLYFEGIIEAMGPKELVTLANGRVFNRRLITVSASDGQKGFFETRDGMIAHMEVKEFKVGSRVKVGFLLLGSVKNEKTFNNLFANHIEPTTDERD
jgi:hypothetical protein